jgi:hypothetical protein
MHAAHAPVIPVGTHKDVLLRQIGKLCSDPVEQAKQLKTMLLQAEGLIRARFEGTHFFPYLASNLAEGLSFFPVDNTKNGDDPTVQLLRQKVETLASKEEYIDKQIPHAWLRVLDRLQLHGDTDVSTDADGRASGQRKRPRRRLALSEVYEVAIASGIPSSASLSLEEEVGALLDLFHELGMLVHYNEPKLNDIVILDPQWLIDLIARFIRVLDDGTDEGGHGLHALPVDDAARRMLPVQWRMLTGEGKLARPLLDLLWGAGEIAYNDEVGGDSQLTESSEERDTLLYLLEKFDLLLLLRETSATPQATELTQERMPSSSIAGESNRMNEVYLVPAMLPVWSGGEVSGGKVGSLPVQEEGTPSMPEFFLVFRELPSDGELTVEEAAKGFLPEGLFPRLLKKAMNW